MESKIKKVFVILAIALCFIVVQNASAETVIVAGEITEIATSPNVVLVDGIAVNGVRLKYLCNQYEICLEEGDTVSFETYEYTCKDGTTILKATSITVGDVKVVLR